ncbi:MAG: transporter, family, macrolide efflux protein [Candidatus Thermoplasmatota archaeon]|nr:transporter, family, macrolide efflux protein [Candidatus Thermoplasmatota archaeon]
MGESQGPADEKRLMRRFFVIWGAQASSLIGSALVQFALVWWLTIETGSATVLAIAMVAAMLPQILLGPFAGALVDRWNRRRVMISADVGIALATSVLIALFALDFVEVWHIYALLMVRSAGGSFHWPAMAASTTLMVPKKHLARVGGLNQAIQGAVGIAGPALGAVLLLALPMWAVLSVDVLTAAVAVAPLLFVKIPQPARAEGGAGERSTVFADMRDGFRFLRSWKGALTLILMITVINLLFTPAMALMPILVTSYFGEGLVEFATMEVATGASFIVGGLALGVWGGFKRKVVTMLVAGLLSGAGVTLVGVLPPEGFYIAVAGMFFAGFMIAMLNGAAQALMQSSIPPEKQGRVFGLIGSLTVSVSPLGLAFAGPVSDLVGVQIWFIVAGVGLSAIMAGGFLMRSVMTIEDTGYHQVAVEEK